MKICSALTFAASLFGLAFFRLDIRPPIPEEALRGVFYRRIGNYYMVLRFYENGDLMSVSIKTSDLAEAWIQINQWFHRDTHLSDLSHGKYSLYHGYLSFDATSTMGTVTYHGVYDGQNLQLNSFSHINQHRAKREDYYALSVQDSGFSGVYAFTHGQRNHVFRFYEDGLVIHATIFTDDLSESWDRVQMWFHPDSRHLMVRRGRYCIQEGRLRFILGWIPTQQDSGLRYEGLILDDSLLLNSYASDRISAQQEYRRLLVSY